MTFLNRDDNVSRPESVHSLRANNHQFLLSEVAKGAVSPETALTAQELGLSRLFVRIMKRRQGRTRIFMEINGKYYLDEKALRGMK
jgi:hypothetical protein